jgi:thiol-disulfide isomerase/thioredoxin
MKRNEIKHLDLLSFKQMMNDERPTVVKFFNPKCHLCVGLSPIYEQLNEQYGDFYDFAKLNTTKHPKIARVFKIEGVPELFVIMKDFVQQIPYPDDDLADPNCGYPKDYIVEHLEKIKELLSHMQQGC